MGSIHIHVCTHVCVCVCTLFLKYFVINGTNTRYENLQKLRRDKKERREKKKTIYNLNNMELQTF